jgi:ABC-type bacteriocin/lantibiotic exporter with double-glycine peptidase domain
VPLKFQQLAINSLVEKGTLRTLAWLCAGYLGAVLLSAGAKFLLGLRLAVVGEQVVLLIRERLYANHLAAPGDEKREAQGTLVTMLAAEAELVGAFAGSAISTPVVQIGTLISVIGFIAASQPWLGLLAAAVVVPQAVIVIALQGRINEGVRARVQALRDASRRIAGPDASGVREAVVADFRSIYRTRRRVFGLKLSSKFALAVIRALGMIGILFVGGLMVIDGRSDVGTVVASLSGLSRIDGPWRDLVSFFRSASTVRVKYAMLLPAITAKCS